MVTPSRSTLRQPTPETLREQVVLEELDLAPDASFAIVTRRVVEGERYVSHLWQVPLDGAEPRRLTTGSVRDMRPTLSPDGARVAFTRANPADDKAATGIRILDLSGGEPVAPALGELSAGEVAWSPDGTRLAFTAQVDPHRLSIGAVPKDKEPLARRITTLDYRYDEEGYLDRRSQAHVVEAADGAVPRRLTGLAGGVSEVCWRPDGDAIAFVADPREDADLHPRTSIWEVDVDGPVIPGDALPGPREVLALAGPVRAPEYSPDGRWLVAVGVDDPDYLDDLAPTVVVGPADGSGAAVTLAPDLDRPVGDWSDGDLNGWQATARLVPRWDRAGDGVVCLVTDRGRAHPWRFPFDPATGRAGGDPVRLASGDTRAHTFASAGGSSGAGRDVAVLASIDARPPEVCLPDGAGGLRAVTTFGSAWVDDLAWPVMRRVEAPGPGGPVETWIASPADAGDEPLPTVVDIHGGPLGAWSPAPSVEVVLLCARGYRVVLPNIRGSCSYGGEWIRPQLGAWGGPDAEDVHAALDHVVALGLADPDRLGALGLSYGGFMVNWLIGTTDRFRAAVSENGVTNQVSAWAHSDTGQEYCRAALMGDPTTPEGIEQLWHQSPLRNVAAVRTPLLMLQAEADRRCPPADNEQFFAALRWLRRTVEYVVYPEEFHGIQATGRIDRRVDRMTRMLAWFDAHIRAT
ncbi:MAG TPA: prolyl oligopeptidase family serine peptidase [Candidatus Limnocylindrales bacterium]|nr:prolyl oligopeptidase family serine peptidase [Candidatus Limnocylindrales bacterium]